MRILFNVLFFLIFFGTLNAQTTHTAATPNYSDVLEKYNLCVAGDTLAIPAGTAFWKQGELLSVDKTLTIQGAGVGQTIIYVHKTGPTYALFVLQPSVSETIRLSGIEFRGLWRSNVTASASTNIITCLNHGFVVNDPVRFANNTSTVRTPLVGGAPISTGSVYYIKTVPTSDTFTISASLGGAELDITTDITAGSVGLSLGSTNNQYIIGTGGNNEGELIIHNCNFIELPVTNIQWRDVTGLIYKCDVFLPPPGEGIRFLMIANGRDFWGDPDWINPVQWGTAADTVYVEDCNITKSGVTSGGNIYGLIDAINGGGRATFRKNVIKNTRMSVHGTESSSRYRSGRAYEVYQNKFDFFFNPTSSNGGIAIVDMRGGNAMIWDNKLTGILGTAFNFPNYRLAQGFGPWGQADGTKLWDKAYTDDPGQPTGEEGDLVANDGIYETGTASSAGNNILADTGKNWTPNEWVGYSVRQVFQFSATTGGARYVDVDMTGWPDTVWGGWELTRLGDNAKTMVTSNTTTRLTMDGSYYRMDCTGGGDFELSFTGRVSSNTMNSFVFVGHFEGNQRNFKANVDYQIRKVSMILDSAGVSHQLNPLANTTYINHQDIGQIRGGKPSYVFLNRNRTNENIDWSSGTLINPSLGPPNELDIDVFREESSFTGTSGIGSGLFANKPASPTKTGVGWWATDRGDWDTSNDDPTPTNDGEFYVWDGDSWEKYYEPLTYPHPLRGIAIDSIKPSIVAAQINTGSLIITLSEDATGGAAGQFSLSSGSLGGYSINGSTITMTVTPPAVFGDPTYTLNYTAGTIEDLAGNTMDSTSGIVVENISQDVTPDPTRNPGRIRGKNKLFGR